MSHIIQTLRIDFSDFRMLSAQMKFLLSFQLLVLFCLSILVGIIFSPKFTSRVELRSGISLQTVPTQSPTSKSVLSIEASKARMQVGEPQTVYVLYEGDYAEVVDTSITYNPNIVRVDAIKNGPLFNTVLQSKNADGRISFSTALSLQKIKEGKRVRQKGAVYSFTITPLKVAEEIIFDFAPVGTYVWSQRANILTDTRGTLIKAVSKL